jgi:hypothetical protein
MFFHQRYYVVYVHASTVDVLADGSLKMYPSAIGRCIDLGVQRHSDYRYINLAIRSTPQLRVIDCIAWISLISLWNDN